LAKIVEERGVFSKLHKGCRIMGENVDNAKNGVKSYPHLGKVEKSRYLSYTQSYPHYPQKINVE